MHEETPTPRERRLVKNELDFAAYNARRREFEENQQEDIPFVCECGDSACFKVIDATPAEWEKAHSRGDQFVVAPTHVFPNVESIIEQGDRYWVVRKYALTAEA